MDYSSTEQITIYDMGVDNLTLAGTTNIQLDRLGSDPNDVMYFLYGAGQSIPLSSAEIPDNVFYDLEPLSGGVADGLNVSIFAQASKRVLPNVPSFESSSPAYISQNQYFTWQPTGADWIQINMIQIDASNATISQATCVVDDTGSFTVDSSAHSTWSSGEIIYIIFSRAIESNALLPHNNSRSRVVGMYIIGLENQEQTWVLEYWQSGTITVLSELF